MSTLFRKIPLFICFLLAVFFFSSCSVQKRHYVKGYYLERHGFQDGPVVASTGQYVFPASSVILDNCDTITFVNGTVVKARLMKVGEKEIKYKLCDESGGVLLSVARADVVSISYADGREEIFNAQNTPLCVTIIRKNGTEIPAAITKVAGSVIYYRDCSGSDWIRKLDTVFVRRIVYPEGYEKPTDPKKNPWSDSCVVLVKKNGTQMQVRIEGVKKGVYHYTYCSDRNTVMNLNSMFVDHLVFHGQPIDPAVFGEKPAVKTDSCVTIIRKNGNQIRARIQKIDADGISYTYCTGVDPSMKTVERIFVDRIVTDGGVDLLKDKTLEPAKQHSGWATASLLLGILGLFTAGGTGIFAVITGAIGLRKMNNEPDKYMGRGTAVAGIVLGIIGIVALLFVLFMLYVLGLL